MPDQRVALVTPWQQRGGIANYSARLAEELEAAGVAVEPVPIQNHGSRNPFQFGELVDRIPDDVDTVHVQFEAGLFGRLGMTGVGAPWFFHRLVSLEAPVVTTLHEVHANHDHRGTIGGTLLRGRDYVLERLALRTSDAVVVHTREAERVLRARHGSTGRIGRHLLPPEREAKATSTDAAKDRFDLNGPVLLTFGWIESKKRFTDVIRALPELPNVTYFVIGDPRPGDEGVFDDALSLAEKLGVRDRVVRHEYLGADDFDDVYGAADAVVLPYRRVSVSIAVNEALSYEVPTVASSLPYFNELQERYNCLLTYDSQSELVAALETALFDDETQARLESAASDYVAQVNWSSFASWTADLYRDF